NQRFDLNCYSLIQPTVGGARRKFSWARTQQRFPAGGFSSATVSHCARLCARRTMNRWGVNRRLRALISRLQGDELNAHAMCLGTAGWAEGRHFWEVEITLNSTVRTAVFMLARICCYSARLGRGRCDRCTCQQGGCVGLLSV